MHYLHLKQIFKLCGELTDLIKVEPNALLNKYEQFIDPEYLQALTSRQANPTEANSPEDHPPEGHPQEGHPPEANSPEDKQVEDNLSNAIESVDFRLLLGLCLFMLQQEPELTTDVEIDVDTESYYFYQDFWRSFKRISHSLNELFLLFCDQPEKLNEYIKKGDEHSRLFNEWKSGRNNTAENPLYESDKDEIDVKNFDLETFIKFGTLTKQGQARYIEQFGAKFELYITDEDGYPIEDEEGCPIYESSASNWLKEMEMEVDEGEHSCANEDEILH